MQQVHDATSRKQLHTENLYNCINNACPSHRKDNACSSCNFTFHVEILSGICKVVGNIIKEFKVLKKTDVQTTNSLSEHDQNMTYINVLLLRLPGV